jgi:hypothetical protein
MRSRRTTTPTNSRRPGLTGPLDFVEFLGNELICGTLDTFEWVAEETAEHAGYLARRAGQKAIWRIERAVRRRRHSD